MRKIILVALVLGVGLATAGGYVASRNPIAEASVTTVVPSSGGFSRGFIGSWPPCTFDNGAGTCHGGIDIDGPNNLPGNAVYAFAAGTVVQAGTGTNFGCSVIIDHGDQGGGVHIFSLYAHMGRGDGDASTNEACAGGCPSSDCFVNVVVSQQVVKGQPIGNQGNSGSAGGSVPGPTSGVHLHFTLTLGSSFSYAQAFDPAPCIGSGPYTALTQGQTCGPGPTDTDGDGIPDSTDQCDNSPEDFDGYQDADGCPEAGPPNPCSGGPLLCFQQWIHNGCTALHETGADWVFDAADFDRDGFVDLAAINMHDVGSGSTALHVLDGATGLSQFDSNNVVPIGVTNAEQWWWEIGDIDRDGIPDAIGILMNQTGSGMTEIHAFTGATGFQGRIDLVTALHETNRDEWQFDAGDWNRDGFADIAAIRMKNTGSNRTEVHVLNGAASFQQFLSNNYTSLGPSNPTDWSFLLLDDTRDGYVDLLGLKAQATGTFSTEVHALGINKDFFRYQIGTIARRADLTRVSFEAGDWNRDGAPDILVIVKHSTGCGTTEVHVLDGSPMVPPPNGDGDSIIDAIDNCASVTNPSQADTDGDALGDACDDDDDNDGFADGIEGTYGSNSHDAASTPEGPAADAALERNTCDGLDNDLDASIDESFTNTDGDGQADCVDPDDDADACPDANEQQTAVGSETSGGRRDPLNPNDYFNPSQDGLNRIDDVLMVVQAYFDDDADGTPGLPPYEPGYNPDTDRTDDPGSSEAWDLLAGNGLQRIDDILAAVKQFFHDCS